MSAKFDPFHWMLTWSSCWTWAPTLFRHQISFSCLRQTKIHNNEQSKFSFNICIYFNNNLPIINTVREPVFTAIFKFVRMGPKQLKNELFFPNDQDSTVLQKIDRKKWEMVGFSNLAKWINIQRPDHLKLIETI